MKKFNQQITDLKYAVLKKLKRLKDIYNSIMFWWLKKRLHKIIKRIRKMNPKFYELTVRGMFKDLHQDIILDSRPLKQSKKGKIKYTWAILYTRYGNVRVEVWPDEIFVKQVK
jgi:hypothetical protein